MSNLSDSDTIFAVSTGGLRAGVTIIRVSGCRAAEAVRILTRNGPGAARLTEVRSFREPEGSELIDKGLVVWFQGPASFTGEDVVEFHVHGAPSVIRGILEILGRLEGFRIAEAGEFIRRAFHSGKLALDQVEGAADLIAAETVEQRRQAARQLGGVLGIQCEVWRSDLLSVLASVEAGMEFPEEEGVSLDFPHIEKKLDGTLEGIDCTLENADNGERIRLGLGIAIVGETNVGKSSIINRLARRDAAIVSNIAGTTRDIVKVQLDVAGYAVTVSDTAGLRDTKDTLETEGMMRAKEAAYEADIVIGVYDIREWPKRNMPTEELLKNKNSLRIYNKSDLRVLDVGIDCVAVSAKSGTGFDELEDKIKVEVSGLMAALDGSSPIVVRQRHRGVLMECKRSLERASKQKSPELKAEDLRLSLRALGRITGRVGTEDMLDLLFQEFCIGK